MTLWHSIYCSTPGSPIFHCIPEFAHILPSKWWKCFNPGWLLINFVCNPVSVELVMLSNRFILCHPLLLLPSIFPSIRDFSNESVLCIRWPRYWSFSFSISPSNEYSRLISFRMDWFDLLLTKGLSRVFFSTTVRKHQFFGSQPSLWPSSHICTWILENP